MDPFDQAFESFLIAPEAPNTKKGAFCIAAASSPARPATHYEVEANEPHVLSRAKSTEQNCLASEEVARSNILVSYAPQEISFFCGAVQLRKESKWSGNSSFFLELLRIIRESFKK